MSVGTLTTADVHLRETIVRQLDRDPEVDASAIGVATRDGIVTLTGAVESCGDRSTAERVVQRVQGVRGVANDLTVRVKSARTDTDLARGAADAVARWDGVRSTVHKGQVTLTGTVASVTQKREAERAVRQIHGVLGVLNDIAIVEREPVDAIC